MLWLHSKLGRAKETIALGPIAVLLVALPWADGGRTPLGQVWLAGLAGLALALAALRPGQGLLRGVQPVLLTGAALCWASLAWSQCPDETMGAALRATAVLAVFAVAVGAWGTQRGPQVLAAGLSLSLLVSALPAIHQQAGGALTPDSWLDPVFRGVIDSRVCGPTDNPNVFAGYLAYALPLTVGLAVGMSGLLGWACSAAAAVSAGCLLLTYSRAAWLGAAAGVLWVAGSIVLRRQWVAASRLLPLVAVAISTVATHPQAVGLRATHLPRVSEGTFEHRIFMWHAGLAMLRQHPVAGVGLGAFEAAYPAFCAHGVMKPYALVRAPGSAHNDYVQLLAEMGLLGALAAVCLGAWLAARYWRATRADGGRADWVRVGAFGTVLAAALSAVAQSSLQTPLCGVLLALAAAAAISGPATAGVRHESRRLPWLARYAYVVAAAALLLASGARYGAEQARARAQDLAYARRTAAAIALCRSSLRLAPLSSDAHCLVGDIESAVALEHPSTLRLRAAEEAYRASIALDPLSGVLRCKLADTLERLGDATAARAAAEAACGLDWYRASYHLQYGRLAEEAGDLALARDELSTATRLFRLEIDLTRRRGDGGGWYNDVLQRAYSDAVLRHERVCRRLAPARPAVEGTRREVGERLRQALRREHLALPVVHVVVGDVAGAMAATVELALPISGGGGRLALARLEGDALAAMQAGFAADGRVGHVDIAAVRRAIGADGLPQETALFSMSATRQRYLAAKTTPAGSTGAAVMRLGPVRRDPRLAAVVTGMPLVNAHTPAQLIWSRSARDEVGALAACYHPRARDDGLQARVVPGEGPFRRGGRVALTIDDGPYPTTTALVLDVLRRHRARATFFVVGERAEQYPGLVAEMARFGQEVACHGYAHARPEDQSEAETYADMRVCRDLVTAAAGRPPLYVRPPGGRPTELFLLAARDLGLCTALWSRDLGDWSASPAKPVDPTQERFCDGDVVLLHQSGESSVATLEQLLAALREQGLEPASLLDVWPPQQARVAQPRAIIEEWRERW